MNLKIKRLALGMAAVAVAATLQVNGTYAAHATPGDSWIAAVDWEDTKDDEPETTAATTTAPLPRDEQIIVSGKKTWNHGTNPAANRPDSITLIIKADDVIVIQRLITTADHWAWSYKLPKYGRDGREITYTVNEARFEDYVKMVDGYNLANTYMPGHNTDESYPSGVSRLKTDDSNNPALWLTFMGVGFLGLVFAIIILRRKRREEKRS